MSNEVFIAGASVRAAAESARRAGMNPICADLFADEDLREIAQVLPIESYPRDLPRIARTIKSCPWFYTGALENRPDIIAEISGHRPLWGNPPASVAAVRDPLDVATALRAANLPAAEICIGPTLPPQDGTWMLKPLRSAGGRGVCVWDANAEDSPLLRESHYFQKRLAGMPHSAIFIATANRAHLVGVSRQLVGEPTFGATGFAYCGSIGPIRLAPELEYEIERAGACLAKLGQLRGLFGIDFIVERDQVTTVEVNPRYTASVEVFERSQNLALLDWHRRATESFDHPNEAGFVDEFLGERLQALGEKPHVPVVGKGILFAESDLITPSFGTLVPSASPARNLRIADRPDPGTKILVRHPVCTLLIEGDDYSHCQGALLESARALKKWLADRPEKP